MSRKLAKVPPHGDPDSADWYERRLRSEGYLADRRAKAKIIADLCRSELRAAERIADLGSGTGIIKKELEITFGKPIVGFELSDSMLREGERTVRADILRLPAADRAFDFLILNHVYEHVSDPERLFAEAYRVLGTTGRAYVSAGNRYALMEPHYRLPLLSWLPGRAASAYLRLAGRGERYEEIRFLTYGRLVDSMVASGFRVRDITRKAIDDLVGSAWGPAWEGVWRRLQTLPGAALDRALRIASPQWFFMLERPA